MTVGSCPLIWKDKQLMFGICLYHTYPCSSQKILAIELALCLLTVNNHANIQE